RQTQGCWQQERVALLQLNSFFDVSNWITEKDSNCCHWKDIECHNISGRVKGLYLPPKWNRGDSSWYLDVSLFLPFKELKSLNLYGNGIANFIDNKGMNVEELDLSWNRLKNSDLTYIKGLSVKSLNIGGNLLQGSIDIGAVFNNLTNLKKLDMSYNEIESLQYSYVPDVLINLEELVLDGLHLNINILQNIHVLNSLKALSLNDCGLTGTLPTQGWCDLRKLEVLVLSENALEGELPSCLANLSSLYHLDISSNQFIGNGASIALANLTLLRFVSLSQNLFEVPSFFISFANHSHLKVLSSDQNKLVQESTIQTWVPKFQIKVFGLSNCTTKELHNEVPKFLYYQYDLRVIDLSYNNFGGKNNTRLGGFSMKGNSFINRDL
ncbi:hypothetical protein Gotur_018920, partial [Gossypium turneri]